jgi:hypothetical protein
MNITDHERLLESAARLAEKCARESLNLCLMQTMFKSASVQWRCLAFDF